MDFTASASQQAYFTWIVDGEGNAVVEAVAGAGKTTTILKGLDLMSGDVFLGAYNSKMADELKERCAGRKGVYASTFHSAGFKQLKFSFKTAQLRVDKDKCTKIAGWIAADRPDLSPLIPTAVGIVSMAKQRGIAALVAAGNPNDPAVWQDMIDHFDLLADAPETIRVDQVIAFSRAILKRSNDNLSSIDFDDMVYMPLLKRLKMLKHAWVLIDEAQDTNPTRRALAAAMLKPGGRLVAVGDPHQAIFGFTGADNDSLDLIAHQFNATKLALTVSYRCPRSVVAVAREYVSHIEAADTAPEGLVIDLDYKAVVERAQAGDAILCRNNKYLVKTAFALIREGKAAKIEGRKIGNGLVHLAQRFKAKSLHTVKEKAEEYRVRQIEKAYAKKQETKIDDINDLVDTLQIIIDRCLAVNSNATLVDLTELVFSMFGDDVTAADVVTLCSVHRSKGLEWHTVFVLGLNELMPSPNATMDWARQQEINLQYVAVTRAKDTLVIVSGMNDPRS